MNAYIVLFTIVNLLVINCSALSLFQTCSPVNTVANFNLAQYTGKWYEIQRGPFINTIFEAALKCNTALYSITDSRNIQVNNGGYIIGTSYPYNIIGNAYIIDPTQPAKLLVSFKSIFDTSSNAGNNSNYNVIDTDYTTYSLVYSCSTTFFGLIKKEAAWILSRGHTLNQTIVEKLTTKLQSISPTLATSLKPTDQTNCLN